jgi:hypothetical protein
LEAAVIRNTLPIEPLGSSNNSKNLAFVNFEVTTMRNNPSAVVSGTSSNEEQFIRRYLDSGDDSNNKQFICRYLDSGGSSNEEQSIRRYLDSRGSSNEE